MTRAAPWILTLAFLAGCAHESVQVPDELRDEPLAEGLASFYGPGLQGRLTASGERFDKNKLTAAHRELPFGTCLRVVNVENGRSVQVRVTDRGPFVERRILDLSEAAARRLGMVDDGIARVRIFQCRGANRS